MRYVEIFGRRPVKESVADELAASKLAQDACRKLMDHFHQGGECTFVIDRGRRFGIGADQLGIPNADDLMIMFAPRRQDAHAMSGVFGTLAQPIGNYRIVIRIDCLSADPTEAEVAKQCISTGMMQVFKHEFIHFLDARRTQSRIFAKTAPDSHDQAAYLNDPAEFNARYHDLVANLTSLLHETGTPEELADVASLFGLTGNFTADLQTMARSHRGNRQFLQWLTQARRQQLLKRVYRLYCHALAHCGMEPVRRAA